MKLIYASLNLHEVHHVMNLLRSHGIGCHLRNEALSGLAGEVPFAECSARLLLERDSDLEAAMHVLRQWRTGAWSRGPEWACQACGERLQAQFTACWRCGEQRSPA